MINDILLGLGLFVYRFAYFLLVNKKWDAFYQHPIF